MRNLFLAILIATGAAAYGQDTTLSKGERQMYGSYTEKTHQQAIEHQTPNRFLCRLIGFKEYWLNDLGEYIQSQMGFTNDDYVPVTKGYNTEWYTKNGVFMGKAKPQKLKVKFAVNGDGRITSGSINGQFADLAYLFINYWPQDADWLTEVKLKPGVVAQKHSFGDLVTFNWSGATPFIRVTKDPNMSFPVQQPAR